MANMYNQAPKQQEMIGALRVYYPSMKRNFPVNVPQGTLFIIGRWAQAKGRHAQEVPAG